MQKKSKKIVIDWYIPYGIGIALEIKKKILSKKTKYQKIEIFETKNFGKVLFIDGLIQSIEKGEEAYHESLVHPALFSHPEPKKVLIIGGGEGATLREVLKHPVEKVTMVDIDKTMVEVAKKILKFDRGAFKDKRSEVVIQDGFKFLIENNYTYDVIIMDATDPGEGASCPLYTEEFFRICFERLNINGIFVTQGGTCIFLHPERIKKIYKLLKKVFNHVKIYKSPAFGLLPDWVFLIGTKGDIEITKNPSKRIDANFYFYTPNIHSSLFALPLFFEKLLL